MDKIYFKKMTQWRHKKTALMFYDTSGHLYKNITTVVKHRH